MKTLTLFICLLCAPLFAALPPGVVGKKIFEYPNQPVPLGSYLFLIDSGNGTYYNITLTQLQAMGTNSGIIIVTNASFQYITNLYAYLTNIISTNITVQNLITTNVTINVPGGLTNLNLTPLSLMKSDANDAEASVPNGTGILTNNGAGVFGWVAISGLGGNFVLANNGNGTNTTNWGVSTFQEVDAQNFFPTNLFTGLTNYPVLGTDGNGLLILGSATNSFTSTTIIAETNIVNYNYSTNLFSTNITANKITVNNFLSTSNFLDWIVLTNGLGRMTNVWTGPTNTVNVATTSSYDLNYASWTACSITGITGKSNDLASEVLLSLYNLSATNWNLTLGGTILDASGSQSLTVSSGGFALLWLRYTPQGPRTNSVFKAYPVTPLTANTILSADASGNATSVANAYGIMTNNGTGTVGYGWDMALATNLSYAVKTNNGGGNSLVAGSPGTGLTCILTNITADTTLAAMTFWNSGLSVIPVYASCSGGANKQLKFPANFQGAGALYGIDLNGTGVTITNAEASWFEVRCIYGVKTNVFQQYTK